MEKILNKQNYYWSSGKKIWLDIDANKIIVKFDNEQNLQHFILEESLATILQNKTSLALINIQSESDSVFQKIDTTVSVMSKVFAHKLTILKYHFILLVTYYYNQKRT